MSNSNTFVKELNKTSISDAYQYQTFSPYIASSKNILKPNYSPVCVFCSHPESKALMNDGSFRQCNQCKKQFRAVVI
jgi:hypothetical protein